MSFARHFISLLVCASLLALVLGASRPFDSVPAGDTAYSQLEVLSAAGLLDDFKLPDGELSRLETALLIQQALVTYGSDRLDGGSLDSDLETALNGLLVSFKDELAQIGSPVYVSSPAGSMDGAELEKRVSYLEAEVEEIESNEVYLNQVGEECDGCEECCPEEEAIEIQMYGDFYLHADGTIQQDTTGNQTDLGHFHLLWGELGWDVSCEDWSGRFAVLWDDVEHEVDMYEAWARWQPHENWYGQIGHQLLPFGDNDFYFPTYPAVNDLGFTQAHAIGAGYESDRFDFMGYLYNPEVSIVGKKDNFSEFSVVVNLAKQEADECQDGWMLTGGYMSHLAQHDLQLAGDGAMPERVGAYNVFGRYDWNANRYHLLADYTTAARDYDQAHLDADGDGIGDRPCALNVEFAYEPVTDTLYAISYQITDEMADYAENRIGVMYGERLNEMVMMKVEYSHGEFGDFATDNQSHDDAFVFELNLAF